MSQKIKSVLVTGGAGYVGAVLIPKLLSAGYIVKVLDLYVFGDHVFHDAKKHPNLIEVKGDLRDAALVKKELIGIDAVIHLACISNDPSFELDPVLGKSINYDGTVQLVDLAVQFGVKRFIYASSSSVYGVKKEKEVTEDLPLEPLTDYSRYKAICERYILGKQRDGFTVLIFRPATVCGYSPRLRLDLTVNMFTLQALVNRKITVFGGAQKRPNIHIDDMADAYVRSLEYPDNKITGKIYNVGFENYSLSQIASMVAGTLGNTGIKITFAPTSDLRSYHISSKKIKQELGFEAKKTIEDAIRDLQNAYLEGKMPNPLADFRYYNIKTLQEKGYA